MVNTRTRPPRSHEAAIFPIVDHKKSTDGLMKIAARTHPKLYDLCDRLSCSRPAAIGYLELLWGGTAEHAPAGDVGKFTDGAIARWCDWQGEPSMFVESLAESGWLDASEAYRFVIHDWHEHAPNYVKAKLKKLSSPFLSALKSTSDPSVEATGERTVERYTEATASATASPTTRHVTSSHATPRPATSRPASRVEQAGANRWEMLMSAAAAAGFEFPRKPLEACRERGLSSDDVSAVLDFWREHASEFDGHGALKTKLEAMFVGQPVEQGWPKRTRKPQPNGADVGAECEAVRALSDEELQCLAAEAFSRQPGLMANWKQQGRKSGACIEAIAKLRIRGRNGSR